MPEIKIKHVVSFSSEDKVHKAENLLKPETYRKWKCATPSAKSATVVLQFEKATQIHSIDIGNEGSAFVEVLVGRSSDPVSNYQVLLVASSFMSPLESRNGTHTNRVRMFGPEKLSHSTKDEKWDCVQVVCTQPFSKTITYGLTFINFHSPPEKINEQSTTEAEKSTSKLGAFRLKASDDEEDSTPSIGSWFGKQKTKVSESFSSSPDSQSSPSYATAILAASNNTTKLSTQNNAEKRKNEEESDEPREPPAKKTPPTSLKKEHIVYKDALRGTLENKKVSDTSKELKKATSSPKATEKKTVLSPSPLSKPSPSNKPDKAKQKVPLNKIMDRVVFVLSGFVNPLRSELRDKAIEMGAKYKGDWDNTCTHLVCAFINTPKYVQVQKLNGRIVSKEWILDCYKRKEPLLYRNYAMEKKSSSEEQSEEDSEEEIDDSDEDPDFSDELDSDDGDGKRKKIRTRKIILQRKKKPEADNPSKKSPSTPTTNANTGTPKSKNSNTEDNANKLNTPKRKNDSPIFSSKQRKLDISDNSQSPTQIIKRDESETEDEEALQDYVADTDVDDDSGGDTEDEIRKIEMKGRQRNAKSEKMNGLKKGTEITEKPDVANLPLPELPNLFKQKKFFLYGEFSQAKFHDLHRYITAYNGVVESYMSDKTKYVITEGKWDSNFEEALSENEDLIFVKPTWIYKCHDAGKLVPYQPHIVIPDS